ncbi:MULTISPECIES: tagatose-6-phosphate ketose isomerase [unclassified Dyella]|uniref:SIS domain-containing protein n=1 Tax=unclassified Dyella TaxID=2634549 RepID=UPI000CB65236|nr:MULTISPECIES: tagatose-6-phosphate ketose isomerase [unclassified Dyella]MDR3448029.1 tagatose-6-phosphate ketose isomerase [Dyella sp.]PMQ05482.1 putative tagatose-6-phosphate ketose/aldose isomerase [Dyella sp. AD56]
MPVKPSVTVPTLESLKAASPAEQARLGCADTVREILQQPDTWRDTASRLSDPTTQATLRELLATQPEHIVLTGSGSSVYVGECLAPVLQEGLGIPAQAIAAGTLLTHRRGTLPKGRGLLISIARSGDSPESASVVDQVLEAEPDYQHLVVTCNVQGQLATRYRNEPRVRVMQLSPRTNDRSLVMTSSFTNLVLGGSGLLHVHGGPADASLADLAANIATHLFERYGDALAQQGAVDFDAALYLGSGAAFGAAREAALKMLEMSGGAVSAMCETYLGLRHGPMSWLDRPCPVVAFLSSAPAVRAYELDLLREIARKKLGGVRIVVGEAIPTDLIGPGDVAVELPGLSRLDEAQQAMVHVVAGQVLALFRCLSLGQQPDAPSQGVLTRVVQAFAIHGAESGT